MRAPRSLSALAASRATDRRLLEIAQVARMHAEMHRRLLEQTTETTPAEPVDDWMTDTRGV